MYGDLFHLWCRYNGLFGSHCSWVSRSSAPRILHSITNAPTSNDFSHGFCLLHQVRALNQICLKLRVFCLMQYPASSPNRYTFDSFNSYSELGLCLLFWHTVGEHLTFWSLIGAYCSCLLFFDSCWGNWTDRQRARSCFWSLCKSKAF